MEENFYHVYGHAWAWCGPVMACAGLLLQFAALFRRKKLLLLAGAALALAGGAADRDIALMAGDSMAAAGIWLYWRRGN